MKMGLPKQPLNHFYFEGRDLRITTDLRGAMRGLLADHLSISRHALDSTVLPGSAQVAALDLLRV